MCELATKYVPIKIIELFWVFMKKRFGPDGILLFSRERGLNILLNECVPPREYWSLSPRQVSIALTNACNLSCPHCYAPKNRAVLEKELVKKWILELDKAGCFGIGFGGGEPTLYPHLVEICQFSSSQTELAVTMTTHGLNLTESMIDSLRGNVDYIRVSMDGVGQTYEEIRKNPFENFISKIQLLSGRIPFGINYVVNKKTVADLNVAVSLIEDLGASELLLLPEEAVGRGHKIDNQSLNNLKNWISGYKGTLQLTVSASYERQLCAVNPLKKEAPELAYAHIDACGNLKKSSFDAFGIPISSKGVMVAFRELLGDRNENLV